MRVIAGPEKKTRVMSDKERRITAYHEMGHAIVGHYLPNADPVHKISVISRGQALGYTISLPTEDKFLTTRAELQDTMAMTLGGRAAEEIVFGEVTTGASNDLEKVTATAKQMVMRFGMSEKLGPRVFGHDHGQPFLGREFSRRARLLGRDRARDRRRDPADRRAGARAGQGHPRARTATSLEKLSEILIKRETIEKEQFEALLDGGTEEEVFGAEAPPPPEVPIPGTPAGERRESPRPLPRPGSRRRHRRIGPRQSRETRRRTAAQPLSGGVQPRRVALRQPGAELGARRQLGGRQRTPRGGSRSSRSSGGVGVAEGHRRQVPLALDERGDRRVVLDDARDVARVAPRARPRSAARGSRSGRTRPARRRRSASAGSSRARSPPAAGTWS